MLLYWFVNNFDLFIALSAKVEQDIIQANPKARVLHLPHPSYDHFHNPIETSNARKLLNIHKEKHTLLFFGIIREYKGLDILIRAFSSLPSTFQLVIAGEVYGNDEEYKFLISQSKNQQIFLFNEFISDEKVHLFFSSADLCVLPYRSGTQSGVKAIADRMLVPCLISNVGGIAEKIDNDKDGFVLEELNPGALTNRINELFEGNSMQKIKETLRLKKNKVESSWHFFEEKMKEKIEEISLINVQE
ncbi:MAG: glycosyltransferase [Flavobacteriales bacterium]|nr:glycosyltransferase [Flavobacteriales bacterium]